MKELKLNYDVICKRFPHLNQSILKNLDDQSLTRSKEVSRGTTELLYNERFYWIRIIKKYIEHYIGFQESWNQIVYKTSVDMTRQLGTAGPSLVRVQWVQLHPSILSNVCMHPSSKGWLSVSVTPSQEKVWYKVQNC